MFSVPRSVDRQEASTLDAELPMLFSMRRELGKARSCRHKGTRVT